MDNVDKNVNNIVEKNEKRCWNYLKKYSCETHIDHALDMFVAETEQFPVMELLKEEEKLSTKCSYCEEQATYVVSR
mgnify:FL=1